MKRISKLWLLSTIGIIALWEAHFFVFIDWQWVTGEPLRFIFLYIPTIGWLCSTLFTAFIANCKGWSVEKDL